MLQHPAYRINYLQHLSFEQHLEVFGRNIGKSKYFGLEVQEGFSCIELHIKYLLTALEGEVWHDLNIIQIGSTTLSTLLLPTQNLIFEASNAKVALFVEDSLSTIQTDRNELCQG